MAFDPHGAPSDEDEPYSWFDPNEPVGQVIGGSLPHWRQDGVIYFVTWRTIDSMPTDRVKRWLFERDEWLTRNPPPHSKKLKQEYDRLFSHRWEQWLDEGHGACHLAEPPSRALVEASLLHLHGREYVLDTFVVAANHAHVLVCPLDGMELSDITQAWKSSTAHRINRRLGVRGPFWQKESFDHIVRSPRELTRIRHYIMSHRNARMKPFG